MTMTLHGLWLLLSLLACSIPTGSGSSILTPKLDGAYCNGNLSDLNLISATCNGGSCTYGSEVYLYGQGKLQYELFLRDHQQ